MSKALKAVNLKNGTSQNERTPGRSDEVRNNAGGFTFKVSDKDRLERFLILGTDGGTYYVGQRELTDQNTKMLLSLIEKDERMVVDTIVAVSDGGRAVKNSPALFAIAAVMVYGKDKAYAKAAVPKVARTATHLYEYAQYIENLGGWGRAKRESVANWFESKDANSLAYQAVKYRQRNGWTLRDLMRLSHPKGVDRGVGGFILGREAETEVEILNGFRAMQAAISEQNVLSVLGEFKNLPWEAIPTEFLKSEKVWKTLFYNGQLRGQAQVRNITRLARLGAFKDMQFAADFAAALTDEKMLAETRLHPINLLNASVVYNEGQTPKGEYSYWGSSRNKDWTTEAVIKDAIDEAFHLSFKHVEPAGKRTMLAIDVSGSMASPAMGLDLSCAQVSGAVAMTIARTEPAHIIRGFTSAGGSRYYGRGNAELTDLNISAKTPLATAMRNVQKNNFGGTDCAQPMLWAAQQGVEVDTFVVITDNETWAGAVKPFKALKDYRQKTGIDARLAVLGVASTDFTIADPSDRGMMDFVGFDSNGPKALADFSAGRI
jgi:60 kDa SS-A/Ro ribonucleoprotein